MRLEPSWFLVCVCVCVCVCGWGGGCVVTSLSLQGAGIFLFRGGAALPHGSALHSPACTPSPIIGQPPTTPCLYLASPACCTSHFLPLCGLCLLQNSPRSQCRTPRPSRCALPASGGSPLPVSISRGRAFFSASARCKTGQTLLSPSMRLGPKQGAFLCCGHPLVLARMSRRIFSLWVAC
jgi:hypothetical protein